MCQLCSMTRRRLFQGLTATIGSAALSAEITGAIPRASRITNFALLAAAGVAVEKAEAAEPVILGEGQYRYKVLENWGELPPGFTYGDAAAVLRELEACVKLDIRIRIRGGCTTSGPRGRGGRV